MNMSIIIKPQNVMPIKLNDFTVILLKFVLLKHVFKIILSLNKVTNKV